MKKYVFLTRSIEGLSGNPRYVNNKCRWLEEQGWEVVVIWSYNVSKVNLKHIIRFDDESFIFHELNFYPSWFTKRQRESVIKKILCRIGPAEQIVIESNKLQLGAWGEMIAERLNVKHINFVTTEHIKIQNRPTFDFCYAKLIRNEFFTINPSAVKYLFSNYTTIVHPEKYFWSASQGVEIEEYDFESFDMLPKADFTISHFGRSKGYFPYMLEELSHFISKHQERTFNLYFLGDINNVDMIKRVLSFSNVHLVFHNAVEVVPLQLFSKSDIIIATAGCATLASYYGGKVISMNVNKNEPLGLMRYTTLDSNTDSGKYENHLSLSEWLTTLLIEKKEFTMMENDGVSHSYDYQMQYVTQPDSCYLDSSRVREKITKNDRLWIYLSKMGLFRLVDCLYFTKRNKHNKKKTKEKRTIIVEFNGLTGIGKTSVAKKLIDALNKHGFKTVDGHYRHSFLHTMRSPFPELFSISLFRLVHNFASNIPPQKKRKRINWINFYVQKYKSIERYSNADFAIIDEAIIQFLAAIAFNDNIPISDKTDAVVRKIKSMNVDFVRVDCMSNIDNAADRIISRPSKGLIVERMSKEERINKLKAEARNIEYLRSVFSEVYENQTVISINTEVGPEENSRFILGILLNKLTQTAK